MMWSLRPAEIHTMVGELCLHLQYLKSYWSKASWMCNSSLKFDDDLWSLIHRPEVKSDCRKGISTFKRSWLLFCIVLAIPVPELQSVICSTILKRKFDNRPNFTDVTVTWPDLAHIWNFAHICARYSFEYMRNFASLSRRVSELLQKRRGGAKMLPHRLTG